MNNQLNMAKPINTTNNNSVVIREVYQDNLEAEFANVRALIEEYPYVAMDTEFPGVVAKPIGTQHLLKEYTYQSTRLNVDLLNIIQLGLTFSNKDGVYPDNNIVYVYQFNFQFDLENDMYANDSIEMLRKAGINFKKLKEKGINPINFGELLTTSGLVLMENIKWISFHSCKSLQGGLQDSADELGIERVGTMHQAGSDSLLTSKVFFNLLSTFYDNQIEDSRNLNILYGLRAHPVISSSNANYFQSGSSMYNHQRDSAQTNDNILF